MRFKEGGQKKGFHSGHIIHMWVSYFKLWVAGPHSFSMLCWLGPIILSKGIGSPIFSQIPLILVDLHQFLLTFFQLLSHVPPLLALFMLQASLLTAPSIFALYIFQAACGNPVIILTLRAGGFGTHLPRDHRND